MPEFVPQYESYIVVALSVAFVLIIFWAIWSEVRLRKFMRGKDGRSLESTIVEIKKENEQMNAFKKEIDATFKNLHSKIETAARGISTIRFNAFGGRGESGAQSFATAVLNEKGDGFVMSSIHTRDSTRVYAKALTAFESKHELSEEEKRAVSEAKSKTTI